MEGLHPVRVDADVGIDGRGDRTALERGGQHHRGAGGHARGPPDLAEQGLRNPEFAEEWEEENAEGLRGGWEADRRDRELDADGVVGEVIFPDADAVTGGASAPFGAGLAATADVPTELLLAGARAHNRWLAELCATSPDRRAGVALVPIFDVDEAVAEITRARESGLRGGILIPPRLYGYMPRTVVALATRCTASA